MMGEGGWGIRITFNVAFNLGCASTNCKTVVLWYCDPGNLKFVVISLAQMFSLEEE